MLIKRPGNYFWRLGLACQLWFGGGVEPPFSRLQPVGFMVFSGRGGSAADHHVGQSKERIKLMPVLGQPSIPYFPMAK